MIGNVAIEKMEPATSCVSAANHSTVAEIAQRRRMNVHESILSTVGNTPTVRLSQLAPEGVNLYAKLEAFNPLGSVKDRLALGVIEAAERDGSLSPGQTVVEATSGNTGIGLAMVCARKGYPLVVTMAENFSVERRRLMRYLGARVVLTPAAEKGSGMVRKACELAEYHGWYLCRQFVNEANADVHSATTAEEILTDFPHGSLDYYVSGFGTGGTLRGVARELRQRSPATRIVAAEPDNSAMLASGAIQQFDENGESTESHKAFRPHLMQGWSPDFVSRLLADAVRDGHIDEIRAVAGSEALERARDLARREGIFCGISSGATLAAALAVARESEPGTSILCMLPDTGERYLSTPLFEDIGAEMDEEELMLSRSTSGQRFDIPSATPPTLAPIEPSAEASAFVEQAVTSSEEPVAMFALEWCEFCWSVRKLFQAIGVEYRSIDLDSVEYQKDDFGGAIRIALRANTGAATIPQIFVAGRHIGGCTELFDAYRDGTLGALFDVHGIKHASDATLDPYSLLPTWLHPR